MVNCQKLKKRSDFQSLKNKSQAYKAPAFILLYAPHAEALSAVQVLRLGYTATKHTVGGAVKRNRAKRRLRALTDELIRLNPSFSLPKDIKGADMVLIARTRLAETPFDKMRQHLAQTLTEIGCKVS